MNLLEDPKDPHVDPNYIRSDEEMEDDADNRDTKDIKADQDADNEHDGDYHDDAIAGSSQWHSWSYRPHHVAIICIISISSSTLFDIYHFDDL